MSLKDLENKIFAIDSEAWDDRKILFGLEYKNGYLETLMQDDKYKMIWIAKIHFDDFNFIKSKYNRPDRILIKNIFEYKWVK